MLRAYLKKYPKSVFQTHSNVSYIFIFRIHFNKYESEGLFFLSAKNKNRCRKSKRTYLYCSFRLFRYHTDSSSNLLCLLQKKKSTKTSAGVYTPGVYTSTITLGDNTLDVAVSVDADHITSVSLNHLSDSVSAMYPLLEPSLEEINAQLEQISSIDDLN